MTAYASCARCGTRITLGGRSRPNQCCADCIATDSRYCARLMGVKVAMPPKGTTTPEQADARNQRRNEGKRRRRAQTKNAA